jgi:cystathionine gamma-synthase
MNPPITLSSTYVHDASVEYGRDDNETWGALEAALGALDGGHTVTFASGLAAATGIAALVPPGGTVVLPSVAYFGVRNIFDRLQREGRVQVRSDPARTTRCCSSKAKRPQHIVVGRWYRRPDSR